ncbi:peptidoglycan-binding protein [Cognatishimia sp. F0-27]|uniref:peptidoglycan-binding protein n=1 Tax=Cognatishimia sp. F0-27 TaxID=2816855 RepID=UPI001D0C152E|nr:peptidoglycan-binding protein [Cognatishimia sp. F0-27]MCC1492137.1 peptidoglycan-binding protein [Cognatishimia sp. F0-27]
MTVSTKTRALALGGLLFATMLPGALMAAGDALIIGNARYESLPRVYGAGAIVEARDALRDAGMQVSVAQNAGAGDMRRAFRRFVDGLEPGSTDPVVIALAGAFVHSEAGSYLLQADLGDGQSEAVILVNAFSVDAALSVLAGYPGRAFLLLGEGPVEAGAGSDRFLDPGIGPFAIPQGVTVIRGPAQDIADYAQRSLPLPGRRVLNDARRYELDVSGFTPVDLVVLHEDDVVRAREEAEAAQSALEREAEAARRAAEAEAREAAARAAEAAAREEAARAAEAAARQAEEEARLGDERRRLDRAAWRTAVQADSQEGYRAYLDAFPEGSSAAQARQRLSAIDSEPFYRERRREEALDLSREARRNIQRHLSILGYDTRGIDGVFGGGTRGAIRNWQEATGLKPTGYLTADQINRLGRASASRSEELEAEAKARQQAYAQRDRATWQRVEGVGDEEGLRRYVDEFPDGLFADRARAMLDDLERVRATRAQSRDRSAWQQARQADTIASYNGYIQRNPGGAFVSAARSRIAEIERAQQANRAQNRAKAEEDSLDLNMTARRLAEARLKQLGLEVGKVDGTFDRATRRAIRDYQRARALPVSGFLDQQTVVRLLAGSLLMP